MFLPSLKKSIIHRLGQTPRRGWSEAQRGGGSKENKIKKLHINILLYRSFPNDFCPQTYEENFARFDWTKVSIGISKKFEIFDNSQWNDNFLSVLFPQLLVFVIRQRLSGYGSGPGIFTAYPPVSTYWIFCCDYFKELL